MGLIDQFVIASVLLILTQVTYQCDNGFTDALDLEYLQWVSAFGPDWDRFPPGHHDENGNNICYFLASGGNDGDRVLLVSPCLTTSTPRVTLSLAYYLSEYKTGSLNIYIRDGCSDQPFNLPETNVTLIRSLNDTATTNSWVQISLELGDVGAEFQILFEAVMKGETNNSIAIGSISISNASSSSTMTTTSRESIRSTMSSRSPVPSSVSHTSVTLTHETASPTEINEMSETSPTDVDVTMTTPDIYVVTTSSVTLNFCEMHSITNGIDNCTFIGLMCAGIPLLIIFSVWLICYVYNRYCRSCITDPEKQRRHDDDDAEDAPKDGYSTNYAYINSMTDNTYASIHPFGNGFPDEDKNDKKDVLKDKNIESGSQGNDYDIPVEYKEPKGDIAATRSPPKDTEPSKEKPEPDMPGSEDSDYTTLNRAESEDTESDYTALNKDASKESEKDDAQEKANEAVLNQPSLDEFKETSATEESPYFVLEGPTPPSPPSTPIPTLRRNKVHQNDEVVYDVVNDNEPQLEKVATSADTAQRETDSKESDKAEDEHPYFVLAGPMPPTPPDSPAQKPLITQKYPNEDEYDLVDGRAPIIITGAQKESIHDSVDKKNETKPAKDRDINETYDDNYDRPTIPAIRALCVSKDDDIDSDVSEDTYM